MWFFFTSIYWIGLMGSHLLIEANKIIKTSHLIDLITLFSVCRWHSRPIGADGGHIRAPRSETENLQMENGWTQIGRPNLKLKKCTKQNNNKRENGKVDSSEHGRVWEGVAASLFLWSFSTILHQFICTRSRRQHPNDYLYQSDETEKSKFQMNSNLPSGLRSSRSVTAQFMWINKCVCVGRAFLEWISLAK